MTKLSTIIFIGLLTTGSAIAGQMAILPVEGINMTPGELDAIGSVFANNYAKESKTGVIDPKRIQQAMVEGSTYQETAKQLGAEEAIQLTAIRYEHNIKLNAVRIGAGGEEVYRVDMLATSLDDIEIVTDRLAKALFRKLSVEQTRTIHTVAGRETLPENRLFAEKIIGFKTVGNIPLATNNIKLNPNVSAQFDLRLESRKFFLEFGAGFSIPTGGSKDAYGSLFMELGASYYLGNDSISPYIGGGVIPKIFFGPGEAGANLTPYAQIGLMFFRESSTRLYVDLRVSHDLFEHSYDSWNWDAEEASKDYRLTEIGLAIGIGW